MKHCGKDRPAVCAGADLSIGHRASHSVDAARRPRDIPPGLPGEMSTGRFSYLRSRIASSIFELPLWA